MILIDGYYNISKCKKKVTLLLVPLKRRFFPEVLHRNKVLILLFLCTNPILYATEDPTPPPSSETSSSGVSN